jgi:integrase
MNGFRSAWRAACAQAGVSGVTFHDLRGTFATRRLSEGWTTEDVALCTGHSLRDLASLERYVSRAGVAAKRAEAMAKRMAQSGS